MGEKRKRRPRLPSPEKRGLLPRTANEALQRGEEVYFTGLPCEGEFSGHIDLTYAHTGECVACESKAHRREKQRGYQRDWYRKRKAKGQHPSGTGYSFRIPPWQTPEEKKIRRKVYKPRPAGCVVDHIVPVEHDQKGNPITGLEARPNLQYFTPPQNKRKGSYLPDPSNHKIKASHTLTLEELRAFIRAEMAVWSKDVTEEGIVDWSLYHRNDDGTLTYLGEEPKPLRAAAE